MIRELQYVWRLTRSVFTVQFKAPRKSARILVPLAFVAIGAGTATVRSPVAAKSFFPSAPTHVDELLNRARDMRIRLNEVGTLYHSRVEPIERVLRYYRNDVALTRRIATALVSEASRAGIDPELMLAVLLVENPQLEPTAKSSVGATGLMQVMPLHRGRWSACKGALHDIETNICYGTRIFKENLRASDGDVEKALLRYNGCVNGTNTPNCKTYPYHVYARAGRASFLSKLTPQRAAD